ncbi:MAG: ATP-binding protein [Gammaproteobacteria bacterium]|nr:ATP-binding protein [Gammaproteobacteria bacterium]MDH3430881.1 ATP-binding protein [Gammaproteobacteria bacterium]MDH3433844.1 ATP-binding protein [Gammaproteobacteria bacterium]
MHRLERTIRSLSPSTGALFRKSAYGQSGVENFLRDILALANASVRGTRYIITGVECDSKGRKRMSAVSRKDFSGKPAYESLANNHIEPPIRIRYEAVTVEGKRVGVFEIGDCQDRPYMMRIDHSETLRRGDAYVRINDSTVKMGRRQLQALFEKKFQESVSAARIEIGFPGEIIHKDLNLVTCPLDKLPSTIASAKLQELIDAKNRVHASFVSTIVARLTHARLFGSDSPYEERSIDEIMAEMQQVKRQYRDEDEQFLFQEHAIDLQLVVFNQGEEEIHDASLSLAMPVHEAFHVAERLPKILRDDRYIERTPGEQSTYPAVSRRDDSIHVAVQLGDIGPGEPVSVFKTPIRICAGTDLEGRKIGIRYSLFAKNLRSIAKGKLRLLF